MEDNSKVDSNSNYTFLTNQPLGQDLFKNKSQDKIASVISEKIINEPKFKIIGIDGTWGSGKSNLVHLIQNKIHSTHSFFIYDVWGHQEDEQRKAILVELIEFIKNQDGLLKKNGKNWEKKLQELLANSKETTTINQPYLSVGFIFSLLSIVYIPSVNIFKDYSTINNNWGKFLLVFAPIIIVTVIYIYNYFKNWFCNKKGLWKSFRIAAEETFQVYTNKQKEETKIETISENQPSVRDFRKWMEEIDNDLNKKIVIVFDNFDRLPKKHILNIWSSIHIFFAERDYKNIKIILPFDREHVQNAFSEMNGKDINKTYGDDYVNKTFDIVFRVTLPIMSDWKQFFENQWKKAFIIFDDEELQLVIQAYEFLSKRNTPREIIAFINEVLTIKLLDEAFKERYIAIFVLKKEEILKDPLKAITILDYLDGLKSIYHNDSDFAKQITAITYHIDINEALELIYTQELKEALNKNDIEKFNSICNSEFADSIFISTLSDIVILDNPVKVLSKIDDSSKISKLLLKQAWKKFYYQALEDDLKAERLSIEEWQLLLIENFDDDEYLNNLLQQYSQLLTDNNVMDYVDLLDKIFKRVGQDRIYSLLKSKDINAPNLVELIHQKGSDYKKFKLSSFGNAIDQYLSEQTIEVLLEIQNSEVITDNFKLPKYKELLVTKFKEYVSQNSTEKANDILIKLKELDKGKNARLEDIIEDNLIYTLYVNNASSSLQLVDDLIAMRVARGNDFNRSYQSQFDAILSSEDSENAKKVGEVVLNYTTYDKLLLNSDHFRGSGLFKNLLFYIFSSPIERNIDDVNKIIGKYSVIKEALNINDDKLLNEVSNNNIDFSAVELNKLNDVFIQDCLIYKKLQISKDFDKEFNNQFQNLNNEELKTLFDDENNILFKYFENLDSSSLTQRSLDVFKDCFLVKIGQKKVNQKWYKILSKFESNNLNLSIIDTLKDLRDKFLNNSTEIDLETAKQILPLFIKYELLDADTDVFRTIIKNNFLNDDEFVDILILEGEYLKKFYQNSSQAKKEGFKNIINELRATKPRIEDLAKIIGIRISKEKDAKE